MLSRKSPIGCGGGAARGRRAHARRDRRLHAAVLGVITDGVAGLAWTIVLYVLISLLGKRTDPDAPQDGEK